MAKKLTFEQGLEELEQIVSGLESGETTLDESFKQYEKGVKLYAELKKILDEGDAKIIELTKACGEKSGEDEDADA
ncbi:MAG: exodeoxyribonuclease VII small subunit [Clostridia bacterium]|nr:exodeoxyribonuclease VII small subunit [Clostridia bacterium]